jgi:PAS domain S-box-containing protein
MKKEDFLSLYSFIREGLVIFDIEGKIVFVNNACYDIFCCSESAVVGKTMIEIIETFFKNEKESEKEKLIVDIQSLFSDQESTTKKIEGFFIPSANDKKTLVDIGISKINVQGEVFGVFFVDFFRCGVEESVDITKREKHVEMILQSLTSGIVEYDGLFQIKKMNHVAEILLGVKKDEVIGKKVSPDQKNQSGKESLVAVSYPFLAEEVQNISKDGNGEIASSIHELSVSHPKKMYLEVVTIPLTDHETGIQSGFLKVIRDITREKEVSRSKSDFINVAAHQLRTPLSGIKWVLRMVLDGDVGVLSPSQKKLLNKSYETNEKMIALVNDLLNVARIEDSRFGYVFKEGNIVDAISDVIDELRLVADKGRINIVIERLEEIPTFVFDFSKIQLAFHNLIDNSIKYTPEGGTVKVAMTKEDNHLLVKISDTGVGIPKDQMNKMFTKFFRASNVGNIPAGGSGLGLFIVKDIVARHGGKITVESIENGGTTFRMEIPFVHKDEGM